MIRESSILGAVLMLGASTMSMAQGTGNTGTPGQVPNQSTGQTPALARQGLNLQRGDTLVGLSVKDSSGTPLGRIDDIVLRADGSIAYAMVTGLDGSTTYYPVPWSSLRFDNPPGDRLSGEAGRPEGEKGKPGLDRGVPTHATLVGVDAARWKSAPHFERNAWPKDTDKSVWTQSDTFFGPGSGARPMSDLDERAWASMPAFRLSKLQSGALVDPTGQRIGKFNDFVLDPSAGRVNYVSIGVDDKSGATSRTVAMPWGALRATRVDEKDRFETLTARDRFANAPEFTSGDEGWKRMSDPNWVNEMWGYYSVRPYWTTTKERLPSTPNPKPTPGTPPSGPNEKPLGKAG